jgi:hypothetical protein
MWLLRDLRENLTISRALLVVLVFSVGTAKGSAVAPRQVEPTPESRAPESRTIGPAPRLVQAAPDPELRARALMRQFPWITRFWAELRGQERARVERAFRRRGQAEDFDVSWDKMGLQDRVLLLFGPGRARSG